MSTKPSPRRSSSASWRTAPRRSARPRGWNRSTRWPLSEFTARFLERQFAGFAPGLPPCGLYQRTLREVEVPLITAALAATGANQLRAAELLGINRNTLRARIRELGLQVVRSSV
jgi:two-component system, NtrC family, nitrogen regulation response regulator GlnG